MVAVTAADAGAGTGAGATIVDSPAFTAEASSTAGVFSPVTAPVTSTVVTAIDATPEVSFSTALQSPSLLFPSTCVSSSRADEAAPDTRTDFPCAPHISQNPELVRIAAARRGTNDGEGRRGVGSTAGYSCCHCSLPELSREQRECYLLPEFSLLTSRAPSAPPTAAPLTLKTEVTVGR